MFSTELRRLYDRFRSTGHRADESLRSARVLRRWEALESAGFVRISAPCDEDVYANPEDWACETDDPRDPYSPARIAATIEREGAYGVVGSYKLSPGDTHSESDWIHADSVWGNIGYTNPMDPFENPYVVDIMAETIGQFAVAWRGHVGSESRELIHTSHA